MDLIIYKIDLQSAPILLMGWAGLLMGLGWAFAGQIQQLLDTLATLGVAAVGLLAALVAVYLALRWWRRRLFLQGLAMARIDVAELIKLMSAEPRPIIVDVRADAARAIDARRIPGAIGVGLQDIARIAKIDPQGLTRLPPSGRYKAAGWPQALRRRAQDPALL